MAVIEYIGQHWVEWLFTAAVALLTLGYRQIAGRIKEEERKNLAVAEGIQCLLRESIVTAYNRYSDRGYCPIYAKESVKRAYLAYHDLEGNDVATKLYEKLLAMPEELPKGRKGVEDDD